MKILITGGKGNIATMIKKNLSNYYNILNPSHSELDLTNFLDLTNYLKNNGPFNILIHTAILGGRKNITDDYDIVFKNLLMNENLLKYADNFKMIINLDSAAIYDRNTDILNRTEEELNTIPTDYYGFSKYLIYKSIKTFKINKIAY